MPKFERKSSPDYRHIVCIEKKQDLKARRKSFEAVRSLDKYRALRHVVNQILRFSRRARLHVF